MMKKLLSLLLAAAMAFSVCAMLGQTVLAEETLSANVWQPVEIDLTSTVTYENAYTDVEITGIFTHEDGTVISLPGFWYEKDTWKVRFSPTKTGVWTYVVNSTDPANEGLNNKTGKIQAAAATRETALAKHGFVKLTKGERYFSYDDGTPFFWLGDTNWQSPNYVRWKECNYPGCTCGSQFKHEVDNRVAHGFTVYQTYFDAGETDGGGQGLPEGSLWKRKFSLINAKYFNEKVDCMMDYLNEKGMVIALGMGVTNSTVNRIPYEDFLRFSRYVVARYACYSILWISGQEVTSKEFTKLTPTKRVIDIYFDIDQMIYEIDGYKHPTSMHQCGNQPATDQIQLVMDSKPWHSYWLPQSGHGSILQKKSYYEKYYYNKTKSVKPIIEGEANYEDINCGGFVGNDAARFSAWFALMNGCSGCTYGVDGIWANSYNDHGGWMPVFNYEPWYMALDKPGAYEMNYMREFFERLPWTKLIPRFEDASFSPMTSESTKALVSTEDNGIIVVYMCNTSKKSGTVTCLNKDKTYRVFWFNPQNGAYSIIEKSLQSKDGTYELPEKPTSKDWVCLITSEDMLAPYVLESAPTVDLKDNSGKITGSPVTPAAVSAIGSAPAKNKKDPDPALKLCDGNSSTVWSPLVDRVSQTIIFDLGTAQNLTQITIEPDKNTILPPFRLEVSNDQKTWHVQYSDALRDAVTLSDGKISEALTGGYRYVKLLLLNAPDIPKGTTVTYKTTTMSGNAMAANGTYSHTAIAEVTIYADGAAETPAKDTIVDDSKNKPQEATAAPNSDVTPGTDEPNEKKNGCNSFLMPAAVLAVLPAAVVFKKKKH